MNKVKGTACILLKRIAETVVKKGLALHVGQQVHWVLIRVHDHEVTPIMHALL